ncbi:LysR substrate-binding domain-containing protein [Teichococcus oryzae]|uniref:LysR family transcriptional regulator n=1 Tax=Teichococcus oryzae TaxID=1608942 RepID=A0A5B2TER9_9PROT|nr:LysR substrate-binding domain-containing protein [Pseudoroseomonas oryzae]KAA2212614.1 LysR family transcriptional regulator [Pseudoroseomonas oryzae]
MNTRFLATFCAVAEQGSLVGAARQLNLASASVGEQIRALEAELQTRLLARHGRGVVLTEAGHAVFAAARDLLGRVEALHLLARPGKLSGPLRVGAISTALISVVPPALRHMAERHPGIELRVVPGTSAQLLRMLERGEIDCALAPRPHFALPKRFRWSGLRDEPLVLVAPAALAGETVAGLLEAAPFIRMDRASWTGRIVDGFLRDHRLAPRELFELDAQEAIVILVAQGLGVALLPDWGIAAPAQGAIRKLPAGGPRYARSLGMISAGGVREGLVQAFATALRDGLAEPRAKVALGADDQAVAPRSPR